MRCLFIEKHADGLLDLAMRAQREGHQSIYWLGDYDQWKSPVGRGLVNRVADWREHIARADLVVLGANDYGMGEFEAWRQKGIRVIGGNRESARWESDRAYGMRMFQRAGIPVPPYREFRNYDDAIAYVKKQDRPFASKPSGHCDDKALSYVAKQPRDLVYMLERWKRNGKRQGLEFILQEKISGIEVAVGGWFGPGGFAPGIEVNFEHKKLMAGNLGVNCYSSDTDVLTRYGWKTWDAVTESDELAILDGDFIKYEKPSRLVSYHHKGEMIRWHSNRIDLMVTPDHAMWAARRWRHSEPTFSRIPASEIAADRVKYAVRRTAKWDGPATTPPGFTPEKARLWGMYIADGYANNRSVRFGNCPPHKETLIKAAAEACGYHALRYGPDLCINSKSLVEELAHLPKGREARAPKEVMEGDTAVIAAFLDGMSLDAATRHNNLIYTTASRGMADDLQILVAKIGGCAGIRERDRRNEPDRLIKGYVIHGTLSWDVGVSFQPYAWLHPKNCERVEYDGMVYCATVSTGVIMVRRNGKACWNGQCGEMGTVMCYTARDRLADKVLKPLEPLLHKIRYVGNVDVNTLIDENGAPHPLEFTMRSGWPALQIEMALFKVDFCEFLAGLADGKPPKDAHWMDEAAVGLVLAHGDFPLSKMTRREVVGVPIYDIDENDDDLHFSQVALGEAPCPPDFERDSCLVTAGDYVLTAVGTGQTIQEARRRAYRAIERPKLPTEPFFRTDIGDRLIYQLPKLHALGYATKLHYAEDRKAAAD